MMHDSETLEVEIGLAPTSDDDFSSNFNSEESEQSVLYWRKDTTFES
jgi:hypothetical protein